MIGGSHVVFQRARLHPDGPRLGAIHTWSDSDQAAASLLHLRTSSPSFQQSRETSRRLSTSHTDTHSTSTTRLHVVKVRHFAVEFLAFHKHHCRGRHVGPKGIPRISIAHRLVLSARRQLVHGIQGDMAYQREEKYPG